MFLIPSTSYLWIPRVSSEQIEAVYEVEKKPRINAPGGPETLAAAAEDEAPMHLSQIAALYGDEKDRMSNNVMNKKSTIENADTCEVTSGVSTDQASAAIFTPTPTSAAPEIFQLSYLPLAVALTKLLQ